MRRMDVLERDAAPAAATAGTVGAWNAVALAALGQAGADAPAAARALAIVHTGMYNAWAAYDGVARQTMQGVAVRLPHAKRDGASQAAAVGHAAWLALATLLPAQRPLFDARLADAAPAPAVPGPLDPAGIGCVQAAAALDAWRAAATPFAPAVMALEAVAADQAPGAAACASAPDGGAGRDRPAGGRAGVPAPLAPMLHACRLARGMAARGGYGVDQEVLLYFVLANALGDAAIAAARTGAAPADACAAAAGIVLRRFGGIGVREAKTAGADDAAARDVGRKVGALVFERARRYWQGKL